MAESDREKRQSGVRIHDLYAHNRWNPARLLHDEVESVAALTRLRAEGLDGEAQIKQIDYDHDAEMADKMRGVSN